MCLNLIHKNASKREREEKRRLSHSQEEKRKGIAKVNNAQRYYMWVSNKDAFSFLSLQFNDLAR